MILGRPKRSNDKSFLTAGDRARDSKDWKSAVSHYEAHLNHSPDDSGIWVQLGNCAKESREFKKSLLAYERALALEPNEAEIHLQIGHLYKIMGRFNEAGDSYRQALAKDPNLADARHEIAHLAGVAASLPFLMPLTYLDFISSASVGELIEKCSNEQFSVDPFQLYLTLVQEG